MDCPNQFVGPALETGGLSCSDWRAAFCSCSLSRISDSSMELENPRQDQTRFGGPWLAGWFVLQRLGGQKFIAVVVGGKVALRGAHSALNNFLLGGL